MGRVIWAGTPRTVEVTREHYAVADVRRSIKITLITTLHTSRDGKRLRTETYAWNIEKRTTHLLHRPTEYETDPIQRHALEAQRKLSIPFGSGHPGAGALFEPVARALVDPVEKARRGLELELSMPATLLLGNDSDQLFAEADRLKSERDLRLAVVPPMTAIAILLACNQSLWWLSALIAVLVLLGQAISRDDECRSLMRGAVQRDKVQSKSIDEFRNWVANLPEAAEHPGAPGDSPLSDRCSQMGWSADPCWTVHHRAVGSERRAVDDVAAGYWRSARIPNVRYSYSDSLSGPCPHKSGHEPLVPTRPDGFPLELQNPPIPRRGSG